ncbi:MAG: DUF4442 domain-containing protein [Mariprofundus sp.]
MAESVEGRVLSLWQRWGKRPAGRLFFSLVLRRMVPYSGSIHPAVLKLEPGRALIAMRDRRALRNHLHSIHAIALANLGELASGLAMLAALPDNVQAIVTRLDIEYLKKARGRLLAEGNAELPGIITEKVTQVVRAEISDGDGDIVARLNVYWQLRPKDQS